MSFDIGRVFSNTLAMTRERWGPMLGLWATFFGALIIYFMVFGGLIGGSAFALGSALGGGLDDPSALGGLGIGFIVFMLFFYIGYFAIAFGQQGSMVAMASPLRRPTFGEAFTLGLKGGLSFIGVFLLLLVAYFIFILIAMLLGFILSFLGDAAAVLVAILFLPAVVYLACRFAVLVPVIVVEGVFNPIKAISRTWEVTRGNVLGIFVVYVVFAVVAVVALGLPFFLIFGSTVSAAEAGIEPSVGPLLFGGLIFFLVFIAFAIVTAAMAASLHAEISDTQVEELSETFG